MELGKSHFFTDGESIFESFLVPKDILKYWRLTFSAHLEIINYTPCHYRRCLIRSDVDRRRTVDRTMSNDVCWLCNKAVNQPELSGENGW